MRKVLTILCLATIVILAACSKSKSTPEPATGATFQFKSLTATDTVIQVNGITSIAANATGDGLTYVWTSSYGQPVSKGSSAEWTVCHVGKFSISCQVTDKYDHSETKSVIVRSHN
ncbi:MAG: hypothetical protein NT040_07025 [Bacteroidetes bacterium]|nr:hypothetical protein [Bacteroidota bacterium]